MPTFLDLDLDDRRRFLFEAWMFSESPTPAPEASRAAHGYLRVAHHGVAEYQWDTLTVDCSGGTETQVTIPTFANYFWDAEQTSSVIYTCVGDAMPIAGTFYEAGAASNLQQSSLAEEPESGFVESERIIAFRALETSARPASQPAGNTRLSHQAVEFVSRARGRRLQIEEEPERQSE